jgi:flagellin
MTSVNTNYGALVALQNLNATNKQLDEVQNRINTGLKISSAKDNGAVFAIAESLRTRVGALSSVQDGLDRATTAIDTALGAGSSVNETLKLLKQKAIDAQTLTDPNDRALAQADFAALRDSIDATVNAATINGVNLINGTNAASGLSVLTTDIGGGGVGSGAVVEGRVSIGLSTAAVTAVGTLTGLTQVVGTQGAGIIGAQAGDVVSFSLTDPNSSNTTQFNITLAAGQNLNDYIKAVNTTSGGKVTATLDATNNRIIYSSAQKLSFGYTASNSGSLTTATTGAVAKTVGEFFGAGTGTIGTETDGSRTITYAAGTSSSYQTGGGYQTAAAAAFASTVTAASKLVDVITTNNGTGKLTFVVGSASNNNQRTFNISINGLSTIGDLVNAIGVQTNGQITAAFDNASKTLVYKAKETFTVEQGTGNALGTKFAPANGSPATAAVAPTIGSAAAGGGSGSTSTVSGYDFRVNGGLLSSLASLDLTLDPSGAGSTVQTLLDTLNTSLSKLGSQAKALDGQKTFLGTLSDNITKGVGLLVDADLAKESARLQALQVKQQLGAQALSIANQQPSILLSFFR